MKIYKGKATGVLDDTGFKAILGASIAALLSGCMSTASVVADIAVPTISTLNGARENTIQTTIDDKTFTDDVRSAFLNAKNIGVVANDPTVVKVADLFESRGGYNVRLDRVPAGEMTATERRDELQKLCHTHTTDLALIGRITNTDSKGNGLTSMFTGRVTLKQNWTIEMLSCHSHTPLSFDGTLAYDMGSLGQKTQAEYADMIGNGIGGEILAALGK